MTHDDIDASRAPLMEHLVELRRRLIWSVLAVAVAFAVCFWFAKPIYNLLVWPYRLAVGVDTPIEMIYTAPQEFFFTQVKLALFGAIFLAFPVLASQIYMFVAPGLYRNERKAFLPFLAATPILFLLGAAVVYFIAMPLAMSFFLSMQQTGDSTVQIHLTARVSEYLSLIMTLILGFGICFQLPVLLTLLARAGLHHRRRPEEIPPPRHPRRVRGCGCAHPARSHQPDRLGATDHPSLRGVDLRGAHGGEEARRLAAASAGCVARAQIGLTVTCDVHA